MDNIAKDRHQHRYNETIKPQSAEPDDMNAYAPSDSFQPE